MDVKRQQKKTKGENLGPRAVLYARVSSKEQEKEGFSIPAQLKLLNSYAEEKGFKVVKEFVDVETAKSAGRTHFQEMVKFLQANSDVKAILVEKTDRLYRNFKDYVLLEDLNLEIHLVKEGENISRESRSHVKFIHGIKVLMAKNFIDNLSEEVRKGMREKAEQGDYPSRPPQGYRPNLQTNCIELDPERAELVKKLFEWYATGQYSLKQLSQKAYEEGLGYRKSGRRLTPSTLEVLLRNPLYYGYFRWGGKLYHGNHIPLISRELFERVQEVLANRHKAKERQHQFPFKGLLTCGHCGCAITAEQHIKKSGKRYVYYRCTGFKKNCAEPYMREEVLSEKFGEILKLIQINEEILGWIIEALKESNKEEKEYHQGIVSSLNSSSTEGGRFCHVL
jgi:site-specific DNA recombinase